MLFIIFIIADAEDDDAEDADDKRSDGGGRIASHAVVDAVREESCLGGSCSELGDTNVEEEELLLLILLFLFATFL